MTVAAKLQKYELQKVIDIWENLTWLMDEDKFVCAVVDHSVCNHFFWIQYLGDSYVMNSLAACEASKPRDEKIDNISTTIKIDFCFGSIVAESHRFWMIW